VPNKPQVYRADFLEVNLPEMVQQDNVLGSVLVKKHWKNYMEK